MAVTTAAAAARTLTLSTLPATSLGRRAARARAEFFALSAKDQQRAINYMKALRHQAFLPEDDRLSAYADLYPAGRAAVDAHLATLPKRLGTRALKAATLAARGLKFARIALVAGALLA